MIVADERKTRAGAVVSKASKRRRDEAANRTGDDAMIDSSGTLDATGVLSPRPSTDEINTMMGWDAVLVFSGSCKVQLTYSSPLTAYSMGIN